MSETKAPPPAMLWAQSGNEIYITVSMECTDPEYKFAEDSFWFKGTSASDKVVHEVSIDLFGKVKSDGVKCKNIGRCIEFVAPKVDETAEYWPRLNKESKKLPFLRVDFKKWKDEDDPYGDREGVNDMGSAFDGMNFGGQDMSMFNDKSVNLPDFYDDEEDSDDDLDEPPPAEDVKKGEAGGEGDNKETPAQ